MSAPSSGPGMGLPFRLAGSRSPVPVCPYIVDDFLGESWLFSIFGPADTGKTNLAVALARSAGTGAPFFGRAVHRKGAVLIIAAEGGDVTTRRTEYVAHEAGAPVPIAVCDVEIDLSSPGAAEIVISTVEALERETGESCVVVLVDGLSDTLDGDENSPVDAGRYLKTLRTIRRRTRAAVGFIHHSPGADDTKLRGHTKLRAALDLAINVLKKGEVSIAQVKKRRDGRIKGAFSYTLETVRFESLSGQHIETSRLVPVEPEASSADARVERALEIVVAAGGRIRRSDLLARGRAEGLLSTKSASGAEQLRQALKGAEGRVSFDARWVWIPNGSAPIAPPERRGPLIGGPRAIGGDGGEPNGNPKNKPNAQHIGPIGPTGDLPEQAQRHAQSASVGARSKTRRPRSAK